MTWVQRYIFMLKSELLKFCFFLIDTLFSYFSPHFLCNSTFASRRNKGGEKEKSLAPDCRGRLLCLPVEIWGVYACRLFVVVRADRIATLLSEGLGEVVCPYGWLQSIRPFYSLLYPFLRGCYKSASFRRPVKAEGLDGIQAGGGVRSAAEDETPANMVRGIKTPTG